MNLVSELPAGLIGNMAVLAEFGARSVGCASAPNAKRSAEPRSSLVVACRTPGAATDLFASHPRPSAVAGVAL